MLAAVLSFLFPHFVSKLYGLSFVYAVRMKPNYCHNDAELKAFCCCKCRILDNFLLGEGAKESTLIYRFIKTGDIKLLTNCNESV